MKVFYTIGLFLCCSIYGHTQSQELDKLIKTKQDLIKIRDQLSDSIKKIDMRINFLQNQNKPIENIKTGFINTKTKSEAKIKNKPSPLGDVIGTIPAGQTLKVFDYINGYFLIEKDYLKGFTSDLFIIVTPKMAELMRNQDKNEVIKKYVETITKRIFEHQIWIGMTTDMAILSIGRPLEINRSEIRGFDGVRFLLPNLGSFR